MIWFFREDNGDFLAIATDAIRPSSSFDQDCFEGRATAIAGCVGSVCTCGISREYLRTCCRRVAKAKVPAQWRKAIGL